MTDGGGGGGEGGKSNSKVGTRWVRQKEEKKNDVCRRENQLKPDYSVGEFCTAPSSLLHPNFRIKSWSNKRYFIRLTNDAPSLCNTVCVAEISITTTIIITEIIEY